uniref:Uncharacterized protein n=1 Tax=Romanomermis culicivorax TaxID=13658 RepID=A0A915I385_ROMCU
MTAYPDNQDKQETLDLSYEYRYKCCEDNFLVSIEDFNSGSKLLTEIVLAERTKNNAKIKKNKKVVYLCCGNNAQHMGVAKTKNNPTSLSTNVEQWNIEREFKPTSPTQPEIRDMGRVRAV